MSADPHFTLSHHILSLTLTLIPYPKDHGPYTIELGLELPVF